MKSRKHHKMSNWYVEKFLLLILKKECKLKLYHLQKLAPHINQFKMQRSMFKIRYLMRENN